MTAGPDVVVVGGGLAGVTAAVRLADAGCAVTLLESRPKLGGLTHSFRRGSLDIDNGQHVFMRCCTAYRALLDRLGVTSSTTMQPALDVPVVRVSDGRVARLRRDRSPAPLHLGRSLAAYSVLSAPDRLRAVRGALALRAVDRDATATDHVSFGAWLRAHGQTDATIAWLWDLVGVATMNLRADDASLAVAATVFQIGLLSDNDAADIGWSLVPLQQLHGDAATVALERAGATVHTRAKVESVERADHRWLVRTATGETAADAVVVAADPAHTERVVPASVLDLAPGWSGRLGASSIVNVHMVWDRRVMATPFLAAGEGPVQWLFDRTTQAGLDSGQYVAASVSAADTVVNQSVAALRATFVAAVQQLLPAARDAALVDFFVTREPAATFRAAPGSAALRPTTRTRAPGLFLAGAHTATGWPATMEGAVRSGESAAAAVLGSRMTAPEAVTM